MVMYFTGRAAAGGGGVFSCPGPEAVKKYTPAARTAVTNRPAIRFFDRRPNIFNLLQIGVAQGEIKMPAWNAISHDRAEKGCRKMRFRTGHI
jgi:hypothetical protein